MNEAVSAFSPIENVLFWLFVTCFAVSALVLLYRANDLFMVDIPAAGGELTKASSAPHTWQTHFSPHPRPIGYRFPRVRWPHEGESDGRLVPELAKSYTISDDGKTTLLTSRRHYFS